MDRLFELNSECFSLAEQKFKSKELSSEEYQATLKLLQNILENEVQRLTVPSRLVLLYILSHNRIYECDSCLILYFSTTSSLINSNNHSSTTTLANTIPTLTTTTSSNLFQQQSLQFPQSHPPTTTPSLSTFPFAGFGNDTQRHAIQILAAVSASSPYASHYNFLPYIPPLPPAPPPFTLLPTTFPSSVSSSSGRLSPSTKRRHDENSNNNNPHHSDEDNKRARYDSTTTRTIRTHNFDEENIAPVPSLIDANINTLKKYFDLLNRTLFHIVF
jgi:hypothetical protein